MSKSDKVYGYHAAYDFGGDVRNRVQIFGVNVEIEYGYSGQVIGIRIGKGQA